jgi:NADH dehydrogenase [ubiquinone] 1 alpha subcomplex assembly factor 5
MSADPAKPFDRELLRQRRNRVAIGGNRHDFLLRRVTEDICERVQIVRRGFSKVLNLGAHTGVLSRSLRNLTNVGLVVDADHCDGLLTHCDGPCVVCDEEALSFGHGDLDAVVSGLSLQFVNDLPGTLVQVRRALKPDGLLVAALLGGETLRELRHVWFLAEEEITGGASPRVAPFIDVRALGGLSQRAQFALPVVDSEILTVTYKTPMALMEELRAMGASNVLSARRRVPVTRGLLMRACEIYQELFATADGRVPATFEVLTLTAWVPDESQPKPLKPGSATISMTKVLGKNQGR